MIYDKMPYPFGRIYGWLKHRWPQTLVGVGAVLFIGNVLTFYPGFMSNDSLGHLGQAKGVYAITDLTPPALTLLWRFLIMATGHVSAMLIFQLLMLWAALVVCSLYIWRVTRSRKWSLLALAIGVLPFVVNISGVIWKDNQMAFALLLASSFTLFLPSIDSRRLKVAILGAILLLIAYACLVRYNAAVAMAPLIFWSVRQSGFWLLLRRQVAVSVAVLMVTLCLFPIVTSLAHAQSSHPVAAVMLDDIVNVASRSDIEKTTPALRESLRNIQTCTQSKDVLLNSFWTCATDADRAKVQFANYDEIRSTWLHSVLSRPLQYGLYRLETFVVFLFPAENSWYIWQNGIESNILGEHVKEERLGRIAGVYINHFAYQHFPFLFYTWFWLGVALTLLYCRKKATKHRGYITALTLSGVVYILCYLPTGATPDYRYIYWPVLACLLAGVLLAVDIRFRRRSTVLKRG